MPQRIGLLGGTFDPPHRGHLAAAVAVGRSLSLDLVYLVVAHDPWQKAGPDARPLTPAPLRLEMTRALVADTPGVAVDDSEIVRGGPTYTVETLIHWHGRHPGDDLFLIVGADTAARLDTWVRFRELTSLSTLVVVNRGPRDVTLPPGVDRLKVVEVQMDPVDISSTQVRDRVSVGRDVADDVTPGVAELIRQHHLYEDAA